MHIRRNYIDIIKEILIQTGWSQSEFASQMGVTFATVNRWINKHTKPQPTQIRQIERLFKEYVGIQPLAEEDIKDIYDQILVKQKKFKNIKKYFQNQSILEEFLLELTYNSDAIEGSTLNKKETEAIIFDKANIHDKNLIEHLEATNHAVVLRDIFNDKFKLPITENLICQLHKSLMQGIREDAGEYASHQRGIRGVDLILPHPEDIAEEMKLFCHKINKSIDNPISHIARMHADFEAIHPFGDGNGRVGRLIMVIQLLSANLAPCIIPVGQKAQYYEALEYAQKKSPTHLIYFITESILRGYNLFEKFLIKNPFI